MQFDLAKIVTYLKESEESSLEQLGELVAIESVSADPHRREDVGRAAAWLAAELGAIGFASVHAHRTPLHPIVTGHWIGSGDERPTYMVYAHYDVQPPQPLEQWETPPFTVTQRNGRAYGRGTADDKGQLLMHLKVAGAFLATHGELPVNLTLLLEGEEEIGSPSLPAFLQEHSTELAADLAIVSDTPMLAPEIPSIGYGLRGLAYLEVRVRGANQDLHSGQFGGAVPNPAKALVAMLASLHDEQGRVAVPGFYEDVAHVPPEERAAIQALPFDEGQFAAALGLGELPGEVGFTPLERTWIRPTLDVNGLFGGYGGPGSKTVIAGEVGAKLSCRLVPNQRFETIASLVVEHLRRVSPPGVVTEVSVLHGGQPAVLPKDHPVAAVAADALRRAFDTDPVFIRDGGTIPAVAHLDEVLGLRSLLLPFGLPNENKHAPNEWLDLANYRRGMEAIARLWIGLGELHAKRSSS
jgi:acetylornithine deacetylase/succinyl-diaminopimelate desuccinylase-like protein